MADLYNTRIHGAGEITTQCRGGTRVAYGTTNLDMITRGPYPSEPALIKTIKETEFVNGLLIPRC